ncbi:MAG: hypothetical protein OXC70_01130 [Gammaproteobacteria bacterium]|nr:hypothetical protein [Gammaproteobacteria bacterium]
MQHLSRLGNTISISIPAGEDRLIGRECPNPVCKGYFKIELGTGLEGENLPCTCAYCGQSAGHEEFLTTEQIEYVKSIAFRQISDAVYKDLKTLEFDSKPSRSFGLGISLKVDRPQSLPIYRYREKELETELICSNCTLRYSVFGIFAFCPDCGQHNSIQILEKNLEIITRLLDLSVGMQAEISEKLVENALEDCVSAFDGFAREVCRIHAAKAVRSVRSNRLSFQNLATAKKHMAQLFNIDLSKEISPEQWRASSLCFQKRHLVAHRMGVMDDNYVRKSSDPDAVLGQKVQITRREVRQFIEFLSSLATQMTQALRDLSPKHGTRE